jgi:hypothetical protein
LKSRPWLGWHRRGLSARACPLDCCGVARPDGSHRLATSNYNYTTSGTGSFSYHSIIYDSMGKCDRYRAACGDGHVEFDLLCRRCSYSVGPGVSGTGIVTASTGDDAFVTGFPVGGTFNISAGFSSQCGRFPWLCTSNQILDTSLIGGRVTPTGLAAVPSPLIGRMGILTLLCVVIVRLIGIGIE